MSKVAQVIVKLKPKVASLGFNRMEIEGVASRIANNLVMMPQKRTLTLKSTR